jgi:hypothetical protein
MKNFDISVQVARFNTAVARLRVLQAACIPFSQGVEAVVAAASEYMQKNTATQFELMVPPDTNMWERLDDVIMVRTEKGSQCI